MDNVVIVGAGGHGKVVGELVELSSHYKLAGWVDNGTVGQQINGGVILGTDDDLEAIYQSGTRSAVIGVGSVGNVSLRRKLANLLSVIGYQHVSFIHPSAIVSARATIDEGTCVMAGAVVQTAVKIGKHSIVNSRSVIEHDSHLGDFVHVAPGSVIAGGVTIDDDVHIGLGALIREGLTIGEGAFIAAGAVVLEDVSAGDRVAGCPARKI